LLVALAAVACLALHPPAPAAAQEEEPSRCAPTGVPGGEWRTYGQDLANTRHQEQEKSIASTDVPMLTPAWTFSTTDAEGDGDITGTPIVAHGCVYVGTNRGWVFAINADDGELVWKATVPDGGNVNNTVAVTRRRVYALVSRTQRGTACAGEKCVGPYVVAFERRTGDVDWVSKPVDKQPGADVYGSPVVFEGTVMFGVSGGAAELGDEADRYAFQGSMNFLDARTGAILKKTWTIHRPGNPEDDFAGAAIWSTPAIDREKRVAYAGTGNPFRPQAEHEHANAVLKFNVDRDGRRFGKIIGSYKGTIDEYIPGFSELPCYDLPGNSPAGSPQGIGSCGDLDLDFGASPNLFTDSEGRRLVGEGQKSGVYHAFDAKTMKPAWTQIVGPPTLVGGIVGSTAYDGRGIYGPITPLGYLWSLTPDNGGLRWLAPTADGAHYANAVAVANGVAYTTEFTGFLSAYDVRTGLPLLKRPLPLGGSGPVSLTWGSVSVARNTIYAAVGITGLPDGFVVAFRPGGPTDVPEDVQETALGLLQEGGGGAIPAGAGIVAGPGAASTTYATPVMVTQVGGPLSFTNLDIVQHDVTSDDDAPGGGPLFHTKLIGLGQTTEVEGLDDVQSGHTYGFYCSIHPGMRGSLIVR
jgi:polyvinyl alcohol dehydrogenase (cytochrome)